VTALPPEGDIGETLAILHLNENGKTNMAYWKVMERPANLRWRGLFKAGNMVTRRSPPFEYDKTDDFDQDALADWLEADRALFVIEGGRE
jgi:hypothetical protein